jgi:hypothetical protein
MYAADLPAEAAQDIQQILADEYGDWDAMKAGEQTSYASESYYEEKGVSDQAWQADWSAFEQALKTEARFFSRTAAQYLSGVFSGIESMTASDGRPLLIDAGPGTPFASAYRARAFQSDEKLETALCAPVLHLGPPPSLVATAGRMNARGISVFYGASNPDVAVAEVRPPVGSQVTVARFDIIRPVRLLDLTAFDAVSAGGSIFDRETAQRLEKAVFLGSLAARITKPVMPDDEAFEYLPTQAVADFLATEMDVGIDGILFKSVQAGDDGGHRAAEDDAAEAVEADVNLVLFHKASRVEPFEVPAGTETRARTGQMYEEGWEIEYTVIEEVPPAKGNPVALNGTGLGFDFAFLPVPWELTDPDDRQVTLRLAVDSVKVRIVRRVQFSADEYDVKRHRWEKHESAF